jgi:hypothetical protein
MRKILYKVFIQPEKTEAGTLVKGTATYSDFIEKGFFHQWVVLNDYEPHTSNVYGIIEKCEDGTVLLLPMSLIKFIN